MGRSFSCDAHGHASPFTLYLPFIWLAGSPPAKMPGAGQGLLTKALNRDRLVFATLFEFLTSFCDRDHFEIYALVKSAPESFCRCSSSMFRDETTTSESKRSFLHDLFEPSLLFDGHNHAFAEFARLDCGVLFRQSPSCTSPTRRGCILRNLKSFQ